MHTAVMADIGEIVLKKSARAKRMILRFNTAGQPVVIIPRYLPYRFGHQFAVAHRDWILLHQSKQQTTPLQNKQIIGRDHQLLFISSNTDTPTSRVTSTSITVRYPHKLSPTDQVVQSEAERAVKRAIKRQAEYYLLPRLSSLAQQYDFNYREGKVKLLRSRWGSCSRRQVITLNAWLVQLPQELIDYVICHELAHLSHPHHQADFWQAVANMVPEYKKIRKILRAQQPRFIGNESISFT